MATITPRQIGPADRGRTMTLEEYCRAEVVEGFRYELARGVLEVIKIPRESPYGLIICYFYDRIAIYRQARPDIIYRYGGGAEFHLILPQMTSGRNPDVAVVLRGTPKDVEGNRPPSLVIEVVSRGARARKRDYEAKRAEYLSYGLREYWIVEPFARRVTVLIRDGDAWVERIFADGQTASGLVLPGFAVPVSEIWPVPDEAADES